MIELVGVGAFLHNLAEYQTIRDEEYEAAAQEAMDFLRSPLREYAPERAAQTYVRKYILQEGWDDAQMTYQATQDGFTAQLGNPVAYGPYVQGDPDDEPRQTAPFVDRWKPTSAILSDNEGEVVDRFDARTERICVRLGNI